jgi:sialate O-acetylesterase
VPRVTSDKPLDDVKGRWDVCTPETVPGFSAVAYFFGRDLHKALGVPV